MVKKAYLGSQILKPRITTPGILAFHGSGDFGQHLSHKVYLPVMSCTVDRTKPRLKKEQFTCNVMASIGFC